MPRCAGLGLQLMYWAALGSMPALQHHLGSNLHVCCSGLRQLPHELPLAEVCSPDQQPCLNQTRALPTLSVVHCGCAHWTANRSRLWILSHSPPCLVATSITYTTGPRAGQRAQGDQLPVWQEQHHEAGHQQLRRSVSGPCRALLRLDARAGLVVAASGMRLSTAECEQRCVRAGGPCRCWCAW